MFNSKRAIRFKAFLSIFLVFLVLSCFNSYFHNNLPYQQIDKVMKNESIEDMDTINNSIWTPISETLNFSQNDNHFLDQNPQIIEYNVLTKAEKVKDNNNSTIKELSQTNAPEFNGLLEKYYNLQPIQNKDAPQISYPFPPDDRQKVTNTEDFPWRTICKLFITAEDNTKFIGSGAIIDEFHIMTCGHCVYIHDHGGWVSELEVVPGMDASYEPFGHAYATYYRTYTGWTDLEMEEHDWAIVTLDRSIGEFTGWMGRKTADYSSSIYTGTLNTAGYPGDLDYGYCMYYDSDIGEDADEYNHWYWMDTAGGQSGSPVWQYDGDARYILSIHAYQYEDGSYANFGTRLNQNKFDQINTWLSEDSSSPPNDKPDLLDSGYYSGINTGSVITGKTTFAIYCDIKNEGTATAPLFNVNFYASEDLSISATDYLIGSTTINNLVPFNYISADWSGIFPTDIPEGYYYIGWIIDAGNNINEFDESNNIVISSLLQIHVILEKDNPLWSNIIMPLLISISVILIVIATIVVIYKRIPDCRIDFNFE
ncbi:MAG: CARDB domain-containing protein [Promethearchaeota archaeon]